MRTSIISNDKTASRGWDECKIKVDGLMSEDCDDLKALVRAAHREDYFVHVGVSSFVADRNIKDKLKHWDAPAYIQAYGLDSLITLGNIPDYLGPNNSTK